MNKLSAMARLGARFFFILFSLLVLTRKSEGKFSRRPNKPGTALFIFGDSFFDAGNNNYINTSTLEQANFWPYGETFFKFPTGRFSDGRLVSDFIAEYAKLPLIPPFLQPGHDNLHFHGVNFASAGAGALVQTFQGLVINMEKQLNYYKKVENLWRRKLGKQESKKRITRAVYMISIGSNDYTNPFLTNNLTLLNSFSNSQYVGMVIGNMTRLIQEIYKTGGRKFGFMNLPDWGCFPALRILNPEKNQSCFEQVSLLTRLHNRALSELLFELETQLTGFKYSLFDFNRSLKLRMDHPSKYGFMEGEEACCGTGEWRGVFSCGGKRTVKEFELCKNPNAYVFWDSGHLTERTYKQLADEMWSGGGPDNPLVMGPYNFKNLFQIP